MANAEAWTQGWDAGQTAAAKKKKKKSGSASIAGKSFAALGAGAISQAKPGSYKKGGKVRKTGMAKVHKGEIVLTAAQAKMCAGKPSKKKGARKRIATKA